MTKKEPPKLLTRADAVKITAARCPHCRNRGYALASAVQKGKLWCSFCCGAPFEMPRG